MEKIKPKFLVFDCDGILSTHEFYYSEDGKVLKKFGADDNDALSLLKPYLKKIIFVTGDKRGFNITKKRVNDMGYECELVSTIKRIDWIKEKFNLEETIYCGDGIFDHYVFKKIGYAITTCDAFDHVKNEADYVTKRRGGDRAIAEISLHLLDEFFESYNPDKLPNKIINEGRDWTL